MAKNKKFLTENQKKAKERLRIILEISGMKQGEFGRKILGIEGKKDPTYPDRYTCAIFNDNKTPLSSKKARRIKEKFPWIRYEWITGEDDYMTDNDKKFALIAESSKEHFASLLSFKEEVDSRNIAFISLAHLAGYEIFLDSDNSVESLLAATKTGYTVIKEGKAIAHIPLEKLNLLSLDIQELVEQRIRSFLRESEA